MDVVKGMMPKMPNQKEGITYLHKAISIRSDQQEFLEKNTISLSRFVQQKIDEAMGVKRVGK
jgi:hypothetical protein